MPYKAIIAILAATTLGGAVGTVVKLLDIPALSASLFRLAIPSLVLLFYLKIKKVKIIKDNYKILSLASLLNGVRIFLYYFAFLHTSASYGVVILYLHPIFITILGAIFLKEKISRRGMVMVVLGFVGTAVIYAGSFTSMEQKDLIGLTAMLLSSFLFAVSMVILKKESAKTTEVEMVFWHNIVGGILIIPLVIYFRPQFSFNQLIVAPIYYGLLIGIVCFLLFFYVIKRVKLTHYATLTYWEVVSGIAFAALLLNEPITINLVIGAGLIVAAGIGITFDKNPPKAALDSGQTLPLTFPEN